MQTPSQESSPSLEGAQKIEITSCQLGGDAGGACGDTRQQLPLLPASTAAAAAAGPVVQRQVAQVRFCGVAASAFLLPDHRDRHVCKALAACGSQGSASHMLFRSTCALTLHRRCCSTGFITAVNEMHFYRFRREVDVEAQLRIGGMDQSGAAGL